MLAGGEAEAATPVEEATGSQGGVSAAALEAVLVREAALLPDFDRAWPLTEADEAEGGCSTEVAIEDRGLYKEPPMRTIYAHIQIWWALWMQ